MNVKLNAVQQLQLEYESMIKPKPIKQISTNLISFIDDK